MITSAPSARACRTEPAAVVEGISTVAAMPSSRAAYATARP